MSKEKDTTQKMVDAAFDIYHECLGKSNFVAGCKTIIIPLGVFDREKFQEKMMVYVCGGTEEVFTKNMSDFYTDGKDHSEEISAFYTKIRKEVAKLTEDLDRPQEQTFTRTDPYRQEIQHFTVSHNISTQLKSKKLEYQPIKTGLEGRSYGQCIKDALRSIYSHISKFCRKMPEPSSYRIEHNRNYGFVEYYCAKIFHGLRTDPKSGTDLPKYVKQIEKALDSALDKACKNFDRNLREQMKGNFAEKLKESREQATKKER